MPRDGDFRAAIDAALNKADLRHECLTLSSKWLTKARYTGPARVTQVADLFYRFITADAFVSVAGDTVEAAIEEARRTIVQRTEALKMAIAYKGVGKYIRDEELLAAAAIFYDYLTSGHVASVPSAIAPASAEFAANRGIHIPRKRSVG